MSKIGEVRDRLVALLDEHERDGALPTDARFLYYELVQRAYLSNKRPAREGLTRTCTTR